MQLIDVGINLAHDSYDADRDAVVQRAVAAGVTRMVVTGATLASSTAAVELARASPGRLYATAGVHPHHSRELRPGHRDQLRALLQCPEVVAVGECGLDYFRNYSPAADQRAAFSLQLQLAAECGKPVFLHQRDAHADFIAMVREHREQLCDGLAHCFTGNAAELEDCLAAGLHVGITGWICDERRGLHLGQLVARIPRGRLLIETDGPYLLPRDLRPRPASRRNEPMYLPHIAAVIARHRNESLTELAADTSAAAEALFRLPVASAAAHRS